MTFNGVARQGDQFHAFARERGMELRSSSQLGRAHRRVVGGVREQDSVTEKNRPTVN